MGFDSQYTDPEVISSFYRDPESEALQILLALGLQEQQQGIASTSTAAGGTGGTILTDLGGDIGGGGGGGGGPVDPGCPRLDQWILVEENKKAVPKKVASLLFNPKLIYNPLTNQFQEIATLTAMFSPIWNMRSGNAETFTSNTHLAIRDKKDHTGLGITKFSKGQNTCNLDFELGSANTFSGAVKSVEDTETKANVLKIELKTGHIYAISSDGVNFILAHNSKSEV